MILVDVNLLIYATNRAAKQNLAAVAWLDRQLNGSARIGFPWATVLGFLRIATMPRILPNPLMIETAWNQVSTWLSAGPAWIPQPTERHKEVLGILLTLPGIYGNLVSDAHLATLAIEHGLTLCSTDGDFARFPSLNWVNPLAE